MRVKVIKFFMAIIICVLISIPCVVIYAASLSEYTGNFTFCDQIYIGGIYDSKTKFNCDQGNFSVTTRISKQTNGEQASSDYFYVKVYRCDLLTDTYVGCGLMNRSGTTSASWKNMKKDTYRFLLDKSNDGCALKGSVSLYY